MQRQSRARVMRDSEEVWKGRIKSLRRFKEDVKEVQSGFECGITLDGFDDFQEKDTIQAFEIEEVAAEIE
jgi:translation initiation factor IF-2